jgi:hypothetical protein
LRTGIRQEAEEASTPFYNIQYQTIFPSQHPQKQFSAAHFCFFKHATIIQQVPCTRPPKVLDPSTMAGAVPARPMRSNHSNT